MNSNDIRYKKGGRTIAQTPAPKKDRIYGSKVNKVGSASSEKSAKSIVLSNKIIDSLKDKLKVFKEKHPSNDNITLDDLKAVYRRGLGAYSSSHRPTISGGVPNSRNAWAMARVNKFLLKAGGTKVKAAYVQDDDLMKHEYGGETTKYVYLRFGLPTKDEKNNYTNSYQYLYGKKATQEGGISVFEAIEKNGKYYVFLDNSRIRSSFEQLLDSKRDLYLVDGEISNNEGADGELLIVASKFKVIKKINKQDVTEYMPNIKYAKGGKVVVDDKDILKFKKIGVSDVYEIEAIKEIGLQGINFDKNTISKIIKDSFQNLLGASNEYLIDEDSEAITRAIQNDINVRKEQGDSEENIKRYESYLTNERERMRYLDSYRDTQDKTIKEWVSYLGQSDYSDAFKYLILKSVYEYNYDFKTNKLIERSNKTIRNFTNFDAGTLSQLYASNSRFLLKDYVELQAKNVDAIIKSKDVVKQSKDGYWIKFNGGRGVSDEEITKNASELSQLVQNTYWCTKTNASSQLRGGDFYVYVTKGEKELFPRIAIRMEGEEVGEVRGNKSSVQDIEEEMLPIAEDFLLNNIPNNSGKKWLDSITYNKKCIELKQKLESNDGLYDGCVEEIAYLKCDEKKYTLDYSDVNGNFQNLFNLFFSFVLQEKFSSSKYKAADFLQNEYNLKTDKPKYCLQDLSNLYVKDGELYNLEIVFGDVDLYDTKIKSLQKIKIITGSILFEDDLNFTNLTSLGELKLIGGDVNFNNTKVTSLGELESIGGGAFFDNSNIESLGELQSIGKHAYFGNSKIKSLGELKLIGGDAYFNDSKIKSLEKLKSIVGDAVFEKSLLTSLGELESIGAGAYFENSNIKSLGKLKSIGGNAYFDNSKITSLGELESIGGDAKFGESQITSLGELKSIGGNVNFSNSKVTSLGKLKSIGGDVNFKDSKIKSLGELEKIDGYADFDGSDITSLGELKSIGSTAYFKNSNIESLGKLETIGGSADFNNSKITSLGELKSIGGDASFSSSNVKSLGELKSIGRDAYFGDTKIKSLGKLESIGGVAFLSNSNVTSLGELKAIGRNAKFEKSKITSLGKLQSIGGYASFSSSNVKSLGELKSIGGYIFCNPTQLDMFLNIPNLKFNDYYNQVWYDNNLKLNLGGMINEDFRINRGGYRSNQSFENGGELSNNNNAIDNRSIGRDEFTKNRSKARAIIKDYANSKPFQVASAYNKEYGFPTLTMHEYKPSEKELQTKIAKLYPHLQDVYSPTYEEGELERSIFDSYKERFPQLIEEFKIKDYEDLVKKSYEQLIKEIDIQYKTLPIKVEFHTGDKNYENSSEMFDDVVNYNHMWVFLGGEDHPALGQRTMDFNGLTANDKFRAIHDYYGHVVGGFEFGKNGEENAWIEHSKMLSPLSQWALSTESRGQNSYVNYSGINEEVLKRIEIGSSLKKRGLELNDEDMFHEGVAILDTVYDDFVFAQQKATLLPQPYTDYAYYHQPFIDYVPQKLKTQFKDGGSVKYEISDYYDLKLAGGGDIKTKSILMDKIGLNEGNADYLISRSPKLALWFGDALLKYEIEQRKLEYPSVPTPQEYKSLALNFLNYSENTIRYNYANAITTILDWLQHPLTPKQNLRELSWNVALMQAEYFHDELEAMEGQVDFVEPIDNTIQMTFPKTQEGVEYYWVVIPGSFCSEESKRMGHCGRTQYGNNLLSLRSIKPYGKGHTINDSHVTIAYLRSYSGNYFYQVKGKKNQKPNEKYYQYIYDLIVKYIKEDKFDGFRQEYGSDNDYGYKDMTNEQLEYLLSLKPKLFESVGDKILLYNKGILKEKPNLTFTSKFSIAEINELIDTPRMRDNFIMRALRGEFEYREVPEYYWNEVSYQINKESEELLFEYISKITKEPLEEVRENGLDYYFENQNDYDDYWYWVSLIGDTNMQLENDAYNMYLYNVIKEALEVYGNVLELDVDSATLEIDLYKIASIEDIIEAFNNYDKPENAFIYLVNDLNAIEKPNLNEYINDNYYPNYSKEEFNEVLQDRIASGYAKGGELKHINPNNMNNQILKMPSLRKSDFVPNTKIILKEDVFNDNNNHVGTRYFYLEVIDTIGKMVNLKVLNSMGINPILKNVTIQRPISNLLSHGRLFGSSMAKGGELNPDDKEVKEYFAHDSGNVGGVLVGKRHSEGGIQATNKSTGLPLEMEGGEVVITRNAVSSTDKHEFDGKQMTNREILSKINESGGGVSFAEGGDLPENISCKCSGKKYKYGGEELSDYEIIGKMSNNYNQSELEKYGEMEIGEHKGDLIKYKNGEIDIKTLGMNIARKHIEENPNYYK